MARPFKSSPFSGGLCASLLCLCVVHLLGLDKALFLGNNRDPFLKARAVEQNETLEEARTPIRRAVMSPNYIDMDEAGLYRFQQVTQFLEPSDQLYRSSAPFYTGEDTSHQAKEITRDALKQRNIKTVISLNSDAGNPKFRTVFGPDIAYKAVPVQDYTAPTPKELQRITDIFMGNRKRGGVLVWCGYGHGRTGTAISAIQIRVQAELPGLKHAKLARADFEANHVETDKQLQVLEDYQREIPAYRGFNPFKSALVHDNGVTVPLLLHFAESMPTSAVANVDHHGLEAVELHTTTPKVVLRGEELRRPDDILAAGGFRSRGYLALESGHFLTDDQMERSSSLYFHAEEKTLHSRYIATTTDARTALVSSDTLRSLDEVGYIYRIRADEKMIHLSGSIGNYSSRTNRFEHPAVWFIPADQIEGWYNVTTDKVGLHKDDPTRRSFIDRVQAGSAEGFEANPQFKREKYTSQRGFGPLPRLAGFPKRRPHEVGEQGKDGPIARHLSEGEEKAVSAWDEAEWQDFRHESVRDALEGLIEATGGMRSVSLVKRGKPCKTGQGPDGERSSTDGKSRKDLLGFSALAEKTKVSLPEMHRRLRQTTLAIKRVKSPLAANVVTFGPWVAGIVRVFEEESSVLQRAAAITSIVPVAGCFVQYAADSQVGQGDKLDTALCAIGDALMLNPILLPIGVVVHAARIAVQSVPDFWNTLKATYAPSVLYGRRLEGWKSILKEIAKNVTSPEFASDLKTSFHFDVAAVASTLSEAKANLILGRIDASRKASKEEKRKITKAYAKTLKELNRKACGELSKRIERFQKDTRHTMEEILRNSSQIYDDEFFTDFRRRADQNSLLMIMFSWSVNDKLLRLIEKVRKISLHPNGNFLQGLEETLQTEHRQKLNDVVKKSASDTFPHDPAKCVALFEADDEKDVESGLEFIDEPPRCVKKSPRKKGSKRDCIHWREVISTLKKEDVTDCNDEGLWTYRESMTKLINGQLNCGTADDHWSWDQGTRLKHCRIRHGFQYCDFYKHKTMDHKTKMQAYNTGLILEQPPKIVWNGQQ
ncbi:putative heat-labile enterotoxin [Ophiocordyceps polyrhachis-furcata BCC 54312]|uniref:Heat-labile enterotoxin n=1 Tax=Ophiocordyceps polyrhachis-furcata BCC 54312 TaxID=1330021 RepID=A0A367L003_9HYPO|nr:putative heat-labile enterotoxin [Ophiocordyceps polyrhachis-furcata BCC 54312]